MCRPNYLLKDKIMADPLGTLEKIVKVALMIKKAVDEVRNNKTECCEIRKRVVRVSALMTRLQESGMVKDPAMGDPLEALEETLCHAHQLVTACQQSHVMLSIMRARELSRKLRQVKQDISDHMIDSIFATSIKTTIVITNIQGAASNPPLKVQDLAYTSKVQIIWKAFFLLKVFINNLPTR